MWLGRVRRLCSWPVRYHWYVPCKAAWESAITMVMKMVAMIRASTHRPGLWSGRVRFGNTWPVRSHWYVPCKAAWEPGVAMV